MKEVLKRWLDRGGVEMVVVAMIAVAAMVFTLISVVNHERLMTFGWDLGFYDQLTYQLSRGEWPISTFFENKPTLGIRFSPILVLVAPIYWVWADARVLLIVQAVLTAAGAWPLWKVAGLKLKVKGDMGGWLGVAAVIAYLSFIGLQRAVFFDFHPDALMAFLTGWLLYFVGKGEEWRAVVMAVLMVMCKEWAGLLVVGVGVMEVISKKLKVKRKNNDVDGFSWYKLGLVLVVLGVVGFGVTIYGVAKPLAGINTSVFGYGAVGRTPVEVVKTAMNRPWVVIRESVWPVVKMKTVVGSLASVGFLPLLVPVSLIPIAVQLGVRFLDGGHQQAWTMNYHYSVTLTPLLVYGAIMAIAGLRREKLRMILMVWLVGWSLGCMVYFHAPVFSMLKPEFYREPEWLADDKQVLKMIPKKAAVAAQNNLVPQVSARDKVYVLPKVADAEYVVVDLRSGQSSYNFSTGTEEEIKELVRGLVVKGEYDVETEVGKVGLLRRR